MRDKAALMEALREEWIHCQRCPLHEERSHVVFGEGNPDADLLFIGEAPGQQEDETGSPFQGRAGQILDQFLNVAKLDRENDLFVTNVVGCRPTMLNTNDNTGVSFIDNRPPDRKERLACQDRLMKIIYIVDPLLIVTLGKIPFHVLMGRAPVMEKIRGRVFTMTYAGIASTIRYPIFPIYHPAFLARSYNPDESGPWWKTSQDFAQICDILDHLRHAYYGIEVPSRVEKDHGEEHGEEGRKTKGRRAKK